MRSLHNVKRGRWCVCSEEYQRFSYVYRFWHTAIVHFIDMYVQIRQVHIDIISIYIMNIALT